MKSKLATLGVALLLCASVFSAESDPSPNGSEMPLALYQKIKGHFDNLYGASSSLLPGVAPTNKEEIKQALRKDAAENKDVLIKALNSSKPIHRELAARALEYCGDKKAAVPALSKSLTDDAEVDVRRAAASALAKIADAGGVDALIKGLTDSEESVRGVCASGLGNIKDNRAAEPLMRALAGDMKPMVRLQAAMALSKIKEPKTLDGLKKALNDEKDERVKMAIAGAVRGLTGGSDEQTAEVPSAQDAAGELANLAKEMKEFEGKLREDRHDQAVLVQGKGIEVALAKLIEKLDKG